MLVRYWYKKKVIFFMISVKYVFFFRKEVKNFGGRKKGICWLCFFEGEESDEFWMGNLIIVVGAVFFLSFVFGERVVDV